MTPLSSRCVLVHGEFIKLLRTMDRLHGEPGIAFLAYLVALHSDVLENPGEFSALSWEGMLKCVPFNFILKHQFCVLSVALVFLSFSNLLFLFPVLLLFKSLFHDNVIFVAKLIFYLFCFPVFSFLNFPSHSIINKFTIVIHSFFFFNLSICLFSFPVFFFISSYFAELSFSFCLPSHSYCLCRYIFFFVWSFPFS